MTLFTSQVHQFDHILLCSPSGALINEAQFDRACGYFRASGLPLIEQGNVRLRHQRFAGEDEQRIQAINMAFGMKQSGLIISSRGGYGLTRLLDLLDLALLAEQANKFGHVFCGHSDITALQLALLSVGCNGNSLLHGPMACFDFGADNGLNRETERYWLNAIKLGEVSVDWEASVHSAKHDINGQFEGTVWGGNLSMICSLIGTPYFPSIQGGILILEDVNEPAYRVERMLLQLFQAGVIDQQRLIIIGDLGVSKSTSHDNGYDYSSAIAYLSTKTTTPIVTGFPFGHCEPKASFYQGVKGKCNLTESHATFTQNIQ